MSDDSIVLNVDVDIGDVLFSDDMFARSTLVEHFSVATMSNVLAYVRGGSRNFCMVGLRTIGTRSVRKFLRPRPLCAVTMPI